MMMMDEARATQSLGHGRRSDAVVVALRRTSDGEMFDLNGERRRWIVGSNPDNDLAFDDPYLSKLHCVLERRAGGALVVRDADSRNGTYIDGNPIESAELRAGAFLTVGATTLVATAVRPNEPRRAIDMLRGRDPALRGTMAQAIAAARTDCSVLVLGETGTGKDLLARLIHESSRRANGPFVAVNCGSIARELVASELFGHEKGAFTGAIDTRDGWFVEADGGTLFLDEIGELPLELQPHLLRVLETHRVRRVGGSHERRIDVRIIAATHRTAGLGTEDARLRPDLYHRLATVVLGLTPLRERMSDLGELVESMLEDLAPEVGTRTVSNQAWHALASHDWPGNIRELHKAVQRAVALGGQELCPRDFFPHTPKPAHRLIPVMPALADGTDEREQLQPYHLALRGAMEQALATHGTIRAAASALGMPKSTFADKARAWGLRVTRRPRPPRRTPKTERAGAMPAPSAPTGSLR